MTDQTPDGTPSDREPEGTESPSATPDAASAPTSPWVAPSPQDVESAAQPPAAPQTPPALDLPPHPGAQAVPPPYPGPAAPPSMPPSYPSAAPQPGPGAYGQQSYGYGQVPLPPVTSAYEIKPRHPQSTLSLVLSIVGLVGGLFCCIPVLLAPFGWFMGSKAISEIDAQPGVYSGRDEAMIGKIVGIIGTVVLGLSVLGLFFFIFVGIVAGASS